MPALTPPSHGLSAAAGDTDATLEAESVFARFRQALPAAPYVDVAIHDDKGEMLWRDQPQSQVSFDQVLRDATDALALGIRYPSLEFPLDEKRASIVLPVWSPDGSLAAIATLVVDTTSRVNAAQVMTPPVRAVLKDMGASLSGLEWSATPAEPQLESPQWRPPLDESDADARRAP